MKKVIRLTENDLAKIVSKVLNENTSLEEKILKTIDRIGILKTIEAIGYNTFDKILPDYFSDKENMIKYINELCDIYGGEINLYDFLGNDIEVGRREVEHDSGDEMIEVDYIYLIEKDIVNVNSYLYDGDNMFDELTDEYSINLIDIDNHILNILFESLVSKYEKDSKINRE